MKKNFNVKRKGFTLVELLIVIVVIGVLSAMMMLSSTEAVTSAKASNIVSNLRNLKTAALAYYVDNLDEAEKKAFSPKIADVAKYMNAGGSTETIDSTYVIVNTNNAGKWYVGKSSIGDSRISEKLAGRADSVGLLDVDGKKFTKDKDAVYMWVLDVSTTAASASTGGGN